MKILVTGYKGFIGKNLVPALGNHNLTFFEWGDPTPDIKGLDWVIHLGAISSTTEVDVNKVMTQNYDFSVWLLNECLLHNVNLQYSSSASIYGLRSEFNENSPADPRSPYAWSKYFFDRHVLNQHFTNIIVQGFRYFNVYGPGEDHKGDQASPYHKFEQQAITTGVIKLFHESDKFYRDFIPVEVVVDIHKHFLNVKESNIWNVGTGKVKSFQTIAEEIADKHSAQITYITMPDHIKNQYQSYTRADITKLCKHYII